MMRPAITVFAVTALCGLMACATAGSRPDATDLESIQLQLTETEEKIDQLTQRLTLVQMMVDSHQRTLQDMGDDMSAQTDLPSGSVVPEPEMQPAADETAPAPDNMTASAVSEIEPSAPEILETVKPPAVEETEEPSAPETAPAEPFTESGDTQAVPPPAANDDIVVPGPNPLYKNAMQIFRNNDYEAAGSLFQAFAQQFPEDDLADNALYWAGECYYAQKNFNAALLRFKQVIETYPSGSKVPDALLKIGYAYLSMGDRESAVTYLKRVVAQYPFSDAGEKAEVRLETLQQ